MSAIQKSTAASPETVSNKHFTGSGLFVRNVFFALSMTMGQTATSQSPPPADKGTVAPGGKFIPARSGKQAGQIQPKTREKAEAALRKDLRIEQVDTNRVRIGLVVLDKASRTVRFPAVVNATRGPVEYAVVHEQGKRHEALFTTKTSPQDLHMAMLLLGVRPGEMKTLPDGTLTTPPAASVRIRVEWETNGPPVTRALALLVALADGNPDNVAGRTMTDGPWLYNGSGFDSGGFQASREGSFISLIGDQAALVNSPGRERENDDIHVPNAALMPKEGMPVTVVITCPEISKNTTGHPGKSADQ